MQQKALKLIIWNSEEFAELLGAGIFFSGYSYSVILWKHIVNGIFTVLLIFITNTINSFNQKINPI